MKMTMWLLILWITLFTGNIQAQDAGKILAEAASVIESSGGMTIHFVMQTRSEVQKITESAEGTVDLRGDKFVLKTPDMITWFDGQTQWSYVIHNEEVNLTTPTGEELQMTNPTLLLRSYKKGYTATYQGECTATNGKSAYTILLQPKKKGDIQQVELQIEKFSHLPASLKLTMKNDLRTTIRITQVKTGVNQPDGYFVFDEKSYPDAEVIDLR